MYVAVSAFFLCGVGIFSWTGRGNAILCPSLSLKLGLKFHPDTIDSVEAVL